MKIWAQKGLGQAHEDHVGSESSRSSTLLKFVGTIHQVRSDEMYHPEGQFQSFRTQIYVHIGYEPTYLFVFAHPKV